MYVLERMQITIWSEPMVLESCSLYWSKVAASVDKEVLEAKENFANAHIDKTEAFAPGEWAYIYITFPIRQAYRTVRNSYIRREDQSVGRAMKDGKNNNGPQNKGRSSIACAKCRRYMQPSTQAGRSRKLSLFAEARSSVTIMVSEQSARLALDMALTATIHGLWSGSNTVVAGQGGFYWRSTNLE
jgi:hypothetical protein